MPLLFQYTDNTHEREFYRNPVSLEDFDARELRQTKETLPLTSGRLTFENLYYDGFRLANSVLTQHKPVNYQVANNLDVIKLYFHRKGITQIYYDQFKKNFVAKAGQCNMLYSSELSTSMVHEDESSAVFSLQMTKPCFFDLIQGGSPSVLKFADAILTNRPVLFSAHWLPIHFAIEQCINQMLQCHFVRDFRKIYLKAKAIELFALFADSAPGDTREVNGFINNNRDREKLYYARSYIAENYTNPLTLSQLAKLSQLNEYKLKKGFRELFGTSVIDFLIACRLDQAKYLLLEKQKNVSEVAYETGYSSPHYFCKAFKKKFGISPSVIRK
jgi:AraC-like DNA-binding protein